MTYQEHTTFLPHHFEPGTYEFTGVWYIEEGGVPVPPPPGWPGVDYPVVTVTVIVE